MSSSSISPPSNPIKGAPRRVTPAGHHDDDDHDHAALSKRMSVEKGIVDELLLVCGVIGSTSVDPKTLQDQFIPVTDCLNWLQDLQRALRRDDDSYRPISLLLGKWKVVPQKLLPLALSCRYDTAIVLTVVKILVILTKPLSEPTKRAGKMVIDTKSRKVPDSVIQEQIKLRDNALRQSDMLMEYKRAIVHHSSHTVRTRSTSSGQSNNAEQGGLLSVFVSLLAEPLSKTGTARSDTDHLTIELVLHLFRNLLSAEPILKSSTESSQASAQLHHELVSLLERELVLEIFLVIAQNMESRENAQYNLLMMELLNNMLRNQDPTSVARCMLDNTKADASTAVDTNKENPIWKPAPKPGSLLGQLYREKKKLRPTSASTRHSHFGGTLVINRPDGKRQYLSASTALGKSAASATLQARKRKNRKTDPFVGSGRAFAAHTAQTGVTDVNPAALRAQRTLHTFCRCFLKDCYGPLMKSLKNEFRRDSVRLEEGDKVVFFRIVWFFCQWWRVAGKGRTLLDKEGLSEQQANPDNALGQLIFTMDVFTFNLVLNSTDTFAQLKKWTQLSQSVALYSEMMQLLYVMFTSKDSTEHVMALGLLDRLFYGSDPLDRLPKLIAGWHPGAFTREYLCDLTELCHVTLKLLERNEKSCAQFAEQNAKQNKAKNDAVARMRQTAAEFNLSTYILRKIVSNQTVFMYSQLLSQYAVNAPHVNHRIISFFLRMSRLQIAASDEDEHYESSMPTNKLAQKTVTLEPMLYHIQLIMVLNHILNDQSIQHDKEYVSLLSFATSMITRFAGQAKANPMFYVECLFRHPVPHRFCELSTNMYVNEELRMIAERELLLEEHRRTEAQENLSGRSTDDIREEDEEEEEGEFEVQFGEEGSTINNGRSAKIEVEEISSDATEDEEKEHEEEHDRDSALTKAGKRILEDGAQDNMEPTVSKKRRREKMVVADSSDDEDQVDFGGHSHSAVDSSAKVLRHILKRTRTAAS